jgi:orotidine-5'-phosphate decarboxylase
MAEVIVALDLPTGKDAMRLVDRLPGLAWAKVGPMLFLEAGPAIIQELKGRGIQVFLDLKWHDIPHAVKGAVRSAGALGIDMATVHTLGGAEMLRRASEAAGRVKLVGVSVLTSHSPQDYSSAVGRNGSMDLGGEVVRLARVAMNAGLAGVVASPLEIELVRKVVGTEGWIVVPGIRPSGGALDDQRRTMDAGSAARAGATHLVVGRPVTEAPDPRAAYEAMLEAAVA